MGYFQLGSLLAPVWGGDGLPAGVPGLGESQCHQLGAGRVPAPSMGSPSVPSLGSFRFCCRWGEVSQCSQSGMPAVPTQGGPSLGGSPSAPSLGHPVCGWSPPGVRGEAPRPGLGGSQCSQFGGAQLRVGSSAPSLGDTPGNVSVPPAWGIPPRSTPVLPVWVTPTWGAHQCSHCRSNSSAPSLGNTHVPRRTPVLPVLGAATPGSSQCHPSAPSLGNIPCPVPQGLGTPRRTPVLPVPLSFPP